VSALGAVGSERRIAVHEVHLHFDILGIVIADADEGVLRQEAGGVPTNVDLRVHEKAALLGGAHAILLRRRRRGQNHGGGHATHRQSDYTFTSHC
jgi:hypothetical protein